VTRRRLAIVVLEVFVAVLVVLAYLIVLTHGFKTF
jgi:hypothetical protein